MLRQLLPQILRLQNLRMKTTPIQHTPKLNSRVLRPTQVTTIIRMRTISHNQRHKRLNTNHLNLTTQRTTRRITSRRNQSSHSRHRRSRSLRRHRTTLKHSRHTTRKKVTNRINSLHYIISTNHKTTKIILVQYSTSHQTTTQKSPPSQQKPPHQKSP